MVDVLLVVEVGVLLGELEDTRLEVETELVELDVLTGAMEAMVDAELVVLVLLVFGAGAKE